MRATQTSESAPDSSKRAFIKYLVGGGALSWLAVSIFGVERYLSPLPGSKRRLPKSVKLTEKADQIANNSGFVFPYGHQPALLVRRENGKFAAFLATCTHIACTVQYDPATKRIVCPCHDGVFDLEGVNISGPPPTPLTRLDVKVKSSQTITVAIRE